jgi:cobalt-zinc-cadmium efflux system protein
VSAHILVDDIRVSRAGEILRGINRLLQKGYGIAHTTIQLECESCQEGFYCDMDRVCAAVGHPHLHKR